MRIRLWQTRHIHLAALSTCLCCGLIGAQPKLRITEPKPDTVVGAGQTITVTVEAAPPEVFHSVAIIGEPFGISDSHPVPPYTFPVNIPARTRPGRYSLTPDGITEPHQKVDAKSVNIQVEHLGAPLALKTDESLLAFREAGAVISLSPVARFADAERVDVGSSSYTEYVSDDLKVATVSSDGWVTAVRPGATKITIRYKGLSTAVPVTVGRAPGGR